MPSCATGLNFIPLGFRSHRSSALRRSAQPNRDYWRPTARVEFSGLAPGLVRLWQLEIVILEDAAPVGGAVPLVITMDGWISRTTITAMLSSVARRATLIHCPDTGSAGRGTARQMVRICRVGPVLLCRGSGSCDISSDREQTPLKPQMNTHTHRAWFSICVHLCSSVVSFIQSLFKTDCA